MDSPLLSADFQQSAGENPAKHILSGGKLKILFIRFSSIGDVVLCSPLIRALKNRSPETSIYFLTKENLLPLLEFNPHLSGILRLKDSLLKTCREVKQHDFDLIIDLHCNLRSRLITLFSGSPVLGYSKENPAKWLLVHTKINRMSGRHVVERYFDALKPLGIQPDGLGAEIFPCDCELPDAESLPGFHLNEKYVVFSIGGAHQTKKMPPEKWSELGRMLNIPILLAGGKEDIREGEQIQQLLADSGKASFNACGKFSLGGSAHLLKNAALVISHDTGLMHMAAAFRRPVVCIWGSTVPAFGFQPYGTRFLNLEVNNLNCRPCARNGRDACPKGHFRCMREQNPADAALQKFITEAISA